MSLLRRIEHGQEGGEQEGGVSSPAPRPSGGGG